MKRRPKRTNYRVTAKADQEAAANAIEADADAMLTSLNGYLDAPAEFASAVIAEMSEMDPRERGSVASACAKFYASMEGNPASHFSKGWRALACMFTLQVIDQIDGGRLSPQFRQATLAECALLRRRAGEHFIRGGARLVSHVMPN